MQPQAPPPPAVVDPVENFQAANDLIYKVEMCKMKREFNINKAKIMMQKKLDALQNSDIDFQFDEDNELAVLNIKWCLKLPMPCRAHCITNDK